MFAPNHLFLSSLLWFRRCCAVTATWISVVAAAGSLAFAVNANAQPRQAEVQHLINVPLVELFTSQGCPNCPAADSTLADLARDGQALALSVHVDYWDYAGWVDPKASRQNTARQIDYKNTLDVPYVFTPQFVLNGQLVMESQALSGLEMAVKMFVRDMPALPIALVALRADGDGEPTDTHGVRLGQVALDEPVQLTFVFFDPPQVTRPDGGRNNGRELFNAHSVRRWVDGGSWRGEARELYWPLPGYYGSALIISHPETREVLGTAARIDRAQARAGTR